MSAIPPVLTRKICLLGRLAVGKTSLVRRFVENVFDEKYQTTVGVSIHTKTIELQGRRLKLIIWDIAGFEQVQHYNQYLRGSHGVIWVADGTEPASWHKLLEIRHSQAATHKLPQLCLINKHDLLDQWLITNQDLDALQAEFSPLLFSSAKTGENVEKGFLLLADQLLQRP